MRFLKYTLFSALAFSSFADAAPTPPPVNITPCETDACLGKFREFRSLARNGSPEAQIVVAGMYYIGYGVEKDAKKALKWYRKAARRGANFATYRAGLLFIYEPSIEQDIEKGMELITDAAESGFPDAIHRLADMYIQGNVVKQDLMQAEKWLLEADKLEHGNSQFRLGLIYESGALGEKQLNKAIEFYQKASKNQNQPAYERLVLLGAVEADPDVFASTANDDIERITVSGPDFMEMLDLSLDTIKDSGLYNKRQTCSRIPGAICGNTSSITSKDGIDDFMNGR